jgi:hypothetical protein
MISHHPNASARSLRSKTASIIFGVLVLIPLANIASAVDPKTVVDKILGEEIAVLHDQMASMSLGCPGGNHGQAPESWGALQVHGNAAVDAFGNARIALAKDDTQTAVQQSNNGMTELDALVNGLHENCSGGAHGLDPNRYGAYVASRDKLKAELTTALRFL